MFDHAAATFESVSGAHWEQTRLRAGECPVTLLIQDTTWLDFAAHPGTRGLGRCGSKKGGEGSGLFLHSVLAVEPLASGRGRVLGLAWGTQWARPAELTSQRRHAHRCDPDRESARWHEAVTRIGAPPAGKSWLHVGDRESDLFELYEQTQSLPGVGFVVRMKQQRSAVVGHAPPQTLRGCDRPPAELKAICRAMPELGRRTLEVKARPGRPGRTATLALSCAPVTIYSPRYGVNGSRVARPLMCWAVRVWEIDPPQDVIEPIEWILLTSEPAQCFEEASRIAGFYCLRWLIEEYHHCLKSGCRIEQRQLESADRLAPLIGMNSVVATRLLQLKNDARTAPDCPARDCVPREELQTMARLLKTEPDKLTVRQFVHEVARLGGFLGRKSDGEPGWQTLWQGWRQLTLITLGFQLAKGNTSYG